MAERVSDAELKARIDAGPPPSSFWWHRTGVMVRVLATASRQETPELDVVYERDGMTFTWPLAGFREWFEAAENAGE